MKFLRLTIFFTFFLTSFLIWAEISWAADYYVDPDFAGASSGTASAPWTSLTAGAWTTINAALASDEVTVYFSARSAAVDEDETATVAVNFLRTDNSTHRLTLDGMSKYNANDAAPSWLAYSGNSRFSISANYPMHSGQGVARNYVTIRGFNIVSTGGQGVYLWDGDNVIIEYNDISHAEGATVGPAITTAYVRNTGHTEEVCVPASSPYPQNCGLDDLVIRHNTIHDSYGECIYIGTCNSASLECELYTNDYNDGVTIEGNTIYNCGSRGGEGDAIDPHGHTKNLAIKDNSIYFTTSSFGRDCIVSEGAGTIERNYLESCPRQGITLSEAWSEAAGFRDGAIVRNNIIVNAGTNSVYSSAYRNGISISHGALADNDGHLHNNDHWTNTIIANNTIFGSSYRGINIDNGTDDIGAIVENNISSQNSGVELYAADGSCATHDYNNLYDTSGNIYTYGATSVAYNGNLSAQEAHSLKTNPSFISVSLPYSKSNFALEDSSAAINAGITLAGFLDDIAGIARPQGSAWDIGAFEYIGGENSTPPAAPSGLAVN